MKTFVAALALAIFSVAAFAQLPGQPPTVPAGTNATLWEYSIYNYVVADSTGPGTFVGPIQVATTVQRIQLYTNAVTCTAHVNNWRATLPTSNQPLGNVMGGPSAYVAHIGWYVTDCEQVQ